ncbi:MAG: glycoside hydrolase [Peptococcaceae bacterium BRH_c8a]|nr:MAG: glycoside hydrolase [Peptococcaceae bacterium BRH_c8a]
MERYLCVHGHFYQPPRENPWLEAVELQDSAHPYHDWNERITAECYAPNTAARILTECGWIRDIINNYSKISFNFGPTLLDWLESNDPDIYRAVIDSDRESMQHFSGHGSSFAQAYNHMIMPLANRRDKYTQVIWGIRDFESRFGRRPEGMWLPETAVDLETLDIMAEHGITFTVLTQYQARRERQIEGGQWQEVSTRGIDPSMCYRLNIPASGRSINIFFYDGPISQAVAFEKLLTNGERFAHRLLGGFSDARQRPQLVHIATDGETYGHHHRHGQMALAYALQFIESNNLARITNYSEFMAMHPPTHEVEIHEHTAWSCAHGVGRWKEDCGCNTGMHEGWNQAWRASLRHALDWLRDTLAPGYEELARQFLKDPWQARNDYIEVVLDRSPVNLNRWLAAQAARPLNEEEKVTVLKLLELQRHAMLMYTSCGWFFDEISGIETVQVIQYARRVIQLAQDLFDTNPEPEFLAMLKEAKSNIPQHRDGAYIYEKYATPAMVDLPKVGAHYAISSLFNDYGRKTPVFCYTVDRLDNRILEAGKSKLVVGQARVTSGVTLESALVSYGVVYFGYHNVSGGVRAFGGEHEFKEMEQGVSEAFNRADFPAVINLLNHYFKNGSIYSLKQLFRDQQRKILDLILTSTLYELEEDYRKIYERHASLMLFLKDLNIPLPQALVCSADFYLNTSLRRTFARDVLNQDKINSLLDEAGALDIELENEGLSYVLEKAMVKSAVDLQADPADIARLELLLAMTKLARSMPFYVDLWKAQNIYHRLLQDVYPDYRGKAGQGDENALIWLNRFDTLGEKLQMERNC